MATPETLRAAIRAFKEKAGGNEFPGFTVAIKAALEAAERGAWRPIEEAPRDGTEIILRKGQRVGAAMWVKWEKSASEYHSNGTYLREYVHDAGEGWTYSLDGDSWDGEKSPTHWQPRPSPPEAGE